MVTERLLGYSMKKRDNRMSPEEFCPIRQTIKILGQRWTMLIIKEIYYSKGQRISFMDLRRRLVNASAKVLSERLKDMAADGLVRRRANTENTPMRVYYTLTQKGKDACHIIEGLKKYGLRWGKKGTFNCENVDCELCAKRRQAVTGQMKRARLV
ncbi:MAG: helix-turn-helix domain-containing protein [Candidatus Altiarchaeota archaeon]|nr:helix-turn-helix domain-containing protein [Candidatus Altiarchaeota archaeon]